MLDRLRETYRRHQGFLLLFILFFAFRLMALVLLRPDASDFSFYYAWGQLGAMGYRTFEELWATYPPLFPALMLPVYELASRIPPWTEPRFFFDVLFGLWLLVFESGNLLLIYRLGGRLDREDRIGAIPNSVSQTRYSLPPGLTAALFYALLFVPFYTVLGWFEPMALFFLLLGLELLLVSRAWGWAGSAVAAALGTLVKLTPALLVPVAIRWLGARLSWRAARAEWFRRQSPGNLLRPTLYVFIYFAVTLGLGLWLGRGNAELALSSFRVQAMRPPWQTVWAVIDGYFGYGLVPVDMRNLVGLETRQWESRIPWLWVTLAFIALYLWLYTRRYDWEKVRTPIAFTAISVIWLFVYNKGWSPQFLIWILAFLVLLKPNLFGICMAVALSLINLVEAYVYLILLPDERWILTGTVVLRTALLIFLAGVYLGQIWPAAVTGRRIGRISRGFAWGVMAAGIVGAILLTPRAAQAYQDRRLAEHPCAAAITYLRAEADGVPATILTEDLAIWQDFYPWLRQDYNLRVIDSYSPTDEPPADVIGHTLDALLQEGQAVWWVEGPEGSLAADTYFTQPGVQTYDEQMLGTCKVAQLVRLPQASSLATFDVAGGPIRLLAAETVPASEGATLNVTLYWQADDAVSESYTVFTQLFDASGVMVAQQDNLPVEGLAPTDTWTPGAVIRDPYHLSLPPGSVPLGETHQLHVGLYNEAGRRSLTLADGTTADHVTFPIPAP